MAYYPTRENGGLPSQPELGEQIREAVLQLDSFQALRLEAWLDEIPAWWRFRARRLWAERVPVSSLTLRRLE